MTAFAPLAGLTVIELSSFVAVPLAGMTMAQLGADVIRIDPIGGAADYRRWPLAESGESFYWAGLNRGKKSVTLDLRSEQGRELVLQLTTAAGDDRGVLITNSVGRGWLSTESLRARREDVIDVRLLGYPDGSPAVDYTVNAALGYPMITGHASDDRPVNHVLPAWDLIAGTNVALAVVAAERARRLTGRGETIEISLWDVAVASAGALGLFAEAQREAADRPKIGNLYYGGFGSDFVTLDGRVMVVTPSDRQWLALIECTESHSAITALEAELGTDLALEAERFAHSGRIVEVLTPWFAVRPSHDVVDALRAAGIVCSVYRGFAELADGTASEWVKNPMIGVVDQPGIGPMSAFGSVLRAQSGTADAVACPVLGSDTADVLTQLLGVEENELERLAAEGVIAGGNAPRA